MFIKCRYYIAERTSKNVVVAFWAPVAGSSCNTIF